MHLARSCLRPKFLVAAAASGALATSCLGRAHCSAAGNTLRLGVCQIMVTESKEENIATAKAALKESASHGSRVVALPEIWNGPYATTSFPEYAEPIPCHSSDIDPKASPSVYMMACAAKEHAVYIIGGSVSERDSEGRIFNTCVVFDPNGEIVGKHRKVHLFDIDIPGKITFKESETLTGGSALTTFDTPWGKVGIGICYDIRFPELALLMRQQGCKLLVYPGAFNQTTGPAHWELLQRARAVDNQVYVVGVSQARNHNAGYQAWGHSTVVSPWAEVVASLEDTPNVIYCDLDMDRVGTVRSQVPISTQRREDLYTLVKPA